MNWTRDDGGQGDETLGGLDPLFSNNPANPAMYPGYVKYLDPGYVLNKNPADALDPGYVRNNLEGGEEEGREGGEIDSNTS